MSTPDFAQPAVPLGEASMPLLGFGTWQIPDEEATEATATALEVGYRHIDTATVYRNEAGVGRGWSQSALPRGDVFVTTKVIPELADRARRTLEESLAKLGTDYVDLWLIHAPPPGRATSVQMWEDLVRAQDDGLARAIGVSNYSLGQIDVLTHATNVTPAVNQIRWSPALYDPAVAAGHAERGIVLEGYSPFQASNLDDPTLVRIAEAHDATPAQVIVAWHIAHGFVVIPKSVRRERIEANAAGTRLELTAGELAELDGLRG